MRDIWNVGLSWRQESVFRLDDARLTPLLRSRLQLADAFEMTPGTNLGPYGLTVTVECCLR